MFLVSRNVEGRCAKRDPTSLSNNIVNKGTFMIGNRFLLEDYCFTSCVYYPATIVTGCEYWPSEKTCLVHTAPIDTGRGEGGHKGSRCLILEPHLKDIPVDASM